MGWLARRIFFLQNMWREVLLLVGLFGARFGLFWAIFGRFWPILDPPPILCGPPRGPTQGFCRGIRVLKRARVGKERPNLARGLARSQNFYSSKSVA